MKKTIAALAFSALALTATTDAARAQGELGGSLGLTAPAAAGIVFGVVLFGVVASDDNAATTTSR